MAGTWSWDDIQGLVVLSSLAATWGAAAMAYGVNKAKIAENATRLDQQQARLDQKRARLDRLEREHSDFRERVAREFVAREHMSELEERFLLAMDRLGKQIDTLSERLDRVLVQATKPQRGGQ